jgi:hypothetical protein
MSIPSVYSTCFLRFDGQDNNHISSNYHAKTSYAGYTSLESHQNTNRHLSHEPALHVSETAKGKCMAIRIAHDTPLSSDATRFLVVSVVEQMRAKCTTTDMI